MSFIIIITRSLMRTKDFMIEYINNSKMQFFILDIETTGLYKTDDEIIELK